MPTLRRRSWFFCWLLALGLLAKRYSPGLSPFLGAGWKPSRCVGVARNVALERFRGTASKKNKEARFRWRSEAGWFRALRSLEDRCGDQYDVSLMDKSWWKTHVKDQTSKLDVTCRHCGHRSCSTSLGSLQNGRSPGCFCNGGVPWSSPAGRARCLEMVGERYGDQYDVSRMDKSWWKGHVKGAMSKLDVTCRHCGHRSCSTSLGSLQNGRSPGCFCNGGVPWSSPAGRARCLEMVGERYGDQYDVSRMDKSWWKTHVKDQTSKLDVTCRHCGHRSCSTSLGSLQNGRSPGCFCNGGVPWSSPAGRARCLEMVGERYGDQYDVSRMDKSWWKGHVKGAMSKLDVTCRHCGHRSCSTSLASLQNGCSPGCFCNGGVPWSSPAGRARCLEMIGERYGDQYDVSRMDKSWWKTHVKDQTSKLDVTCRHCGHRSCSTSLGSLQNGCSPGCFCNGGVPWSSLTGRARCLEIVGERYGDQYDVSRMDRSWWKTHVKDQTSKLDVTCRHCGHRSCSTSLNSLQKGCSPACLCFKKTEGKLMRWLAKSFPQFNITSQVPGCTNPESNRTLPFDFGLRGDTILIELDGSIGHFGFGWGGCEDDRGVPQRDHFKEQWALQNDKTVIRLLQEDVYGDSWDWKGFLTSAIQQSIRNSSPCVMTQDAVQYKSGIYQELRSGIRCQVGHLQPARGAPIPYLTRMEALRSKEGLSLRIGQNVSTSSCQQLCFAYICRKTSSHELHARKGL